MDYDETVRCKACGRGLGEEEPRYVDVTDKLYYSCYCEGCKEAYMNAMLEAGYRARED